jgi:uncharacterized membrane protein YkvA (DUF1232 family)
MNVKTPDHIEKYGKNYSEEDFWAKVKNVARKAGAKVIYVALILYYELSDEKVSLKEKGIILGALGYFILPVDLIPDFLPIAGYTDDLAALVAAFAYVKSHLTPEVRMRAQVKLRDWFGDLDASSIEPEEQ